MNSPQLIGEYLCQPIIDPFVWNGVVYSHGWYVSYVGITPYAHPVTVCTSESIEDLEELIAGIDDYEEAIA